MFVPVFLSVSSTMPLKYFGLLYHSKNRSLYFCCMCVCVCVEMFVFKFTFAVHSNTQPIHCRHFCYLLPLDRQLKMVYVRAIAITSPAFLKRTTEQGTNYDIIDKQVIYLASDYATIETTNWVLEKSKKKRISHIFIHFIFCFLFSGEKEPTFSLKKTNFNGISLLKQNTTAMYTFENILLKPYNLHFN